MSHYDNQPIKLIQRIAKGQVEKARDQFVGVMISDPVLKSIPGPGAVRPLNPNEDLSTYPYSVLAWFCAVKLDGSSDIIEDVIVPTQARDSIGEAGSPVMLLKERTTGAWQVIGRADRVSDVQSVQSYTLAQLNASFVKGVRLASNGDLVSPFFAYTGHSVSNLSETRNGKKQAGLHRGVAGVDSGGNPITNYTAGSSVRRITLGEIVLGTDALGTTIITRYNQDGTTTVTKRNP